MMSQGLTTGQVRRQADRVLAAAVLGFALVVLVPFAGCASYTAKPVPIPRTEAMPLSRTEGALAIRIDPYFDVGRQKAVFDEDFSDEDVLAVQVHVHNAGDGRVGLRPSDMALEFPDGRTLSPSSAAIVAMKVSGGTASVIGAGLAFGGIGFAAAWGARQDVKAKRIADYSSKELQDVTLSRDESRHGFVFFIGPPKLAFEQGTLTIRVIETEGTQTRAVRIPLDGAKPSSISTDR